MAGQIRITPEQMRSRAGEYDREASNVGEVISRMDTLLQELQEEWEGASSQAYASRFGELRPSFVQAEQLINDIATSLRNTAQSLEETDQNIASQFRG
ncbi:WXG100 family type VII secretion target [Bifidobacterium bohemicum]|uniref:ESAT-6-like protein n=1 Tax=Bifidobacterium bohemicum DSM 22767 TaxID=1437606 RepID=A0A086ZG84_9BIFI|nr:WXG100 family type VII secretion target [Bifidobacterium bohemicum]KFI45534.1 hypothetical protein BBOH_1055 [Bifidobacterium bohemicum DSM 22767]SCC02613.1 WXG100 family type VII secretion target [Bifidobacterium bohemicum]